MRPGVGFAFALTFLTFQAADPRVSPAQYMYLDTNGDSVHTDADTISPSGPTVVDVWLRTDARRDGSSASCPEPNEPLDIGSYTFVLQATGGTINWGTFTNRRSPTPYCNGPRSSSTDFYCGLCGTEGLPPGLYHLASLSLTVAEGTPSLHIRQHTELWGAAYTAFGSHCEGRKFDYTIRFGADWFDVDGAGYGGWVNPPVLQQPSDMTVAEGSVANQNLAATDPDGSTITFAKAFGPSYMDVQTASSGQGAATGTIRLAPNYFQSGLAIGEVQVSDGVGSDFRSFGIHVSNTNQEPELDSIRDICLEQGQVAKVLLKAQDPDGGQVVLSGAGLPSFVHFVDAGYNYAYLDITIPMNEEAGSHTIMVFASDGSATDSQSVTLRTGLLGDCSGRAPMQALVYPNPSTASATLSFWTSRPGRLRVTLHDIQGRRIRTLFDDSNAPAANYSLQISGGYPGVPDYLASGVYFYKIEGVDGVSSGRALILRARSSE